VAHNFGGGAAEIEIEVIDPTLADQSTHRLGDNYRVEARIVVWENTAALRAPAGALFQRAGRWQSFVVAGGRSQLRTVKVGRSNGIQTEILDGLSEGAQVIVYPGDKVSADMRVAPLSVTAR
jgi:HlyD family secretion protein